MKLGGLRRLICGVATFFAAALVLFPKSLSAQVLARPGWAGSGVSTEAWWRTAIFYRIDVKQFQDSDGDGIGDLRGVAQRLDYLQELGVDAIVLRAPFDDTGFDDLQFAASRQHVRLLVELAGWDAAATDPAGKVLGEARMWLTRGAAGVSLTTSALPPVANPAAIVHALRALVRSLPGDRILVAEPLPAGVATLAQEPAAVAQAVAVSSRRRPRRVAKVRRAAPRLAQDEGVELVKVTVPVTPGSDAATLNAAATMPAGGAWPLLSSPAQPTAALADALSKIQAAVLLSARGAVMLDAGQELGMASHNVFPWTPTNTTDPKKVAAAAPAYAKEPEKPAPAPRQDVYGAFVPYKPPAKSAVKTEPGADKPDFDAFPGFTTGTLPSPAAPELATRNAAVEEYAPGSVLNFYRRMVQLHHGNASLRSGTPYVLSHDAQHTLVLVRRAPAGSRTAATVVMVCNLGEQAVTLSLTGDVDWLQSRSSVLRPLAASWTETPTIENAQSLEVPAHGSFVGELYHRGR